MFIKEINSALESPLQTHAHNEWCLEDVFGEPIDLMDDPFGGKWLACLSCPLSVSIHGYSVEELLHIAVDKSITKTDNSIKPKS